MELFPETDKERQIAHQKYAEGYKDGKRSSLPRVIMLLALSSTLYRVTIGGVRAIGEGKNFHEELGRLVLANAEDLGFIIEDHIH